MADDASSRIPVNVIGAGFSGLVAAWSLNRDGFDVSVVETASRSGGLIESIESQYGLVETAANGLLASALVEELFLDCGIKIQETKKSSRQRYLLVDSEVTRYPLSFLETLSVIPKIFRVQSVPPKAAETLDVWGRRAFGKALTEKVLGVATLGIYACEASELSANLLAGRYFDRTRTRNRLGRRRGTVSSEGGLETLLKAIRTRLEERGVRFVFGPEEAESFLKRHKPSATVLATSAWKAHEFLKVHSPLDERVDALSRVQSIPLISVTMFFKTRPSRLGFGTLFSQTVPSGESDGILGCLQNSEIFEGRAVSEVHSETWILGGLKHGEELLSQDDAGIVARILNKRNRRIDLRSEENLLEAVVTRWPRAIPHYSTELEKQIPTLKTDHDGILLFGNYLGDLGLSSILESTRRLKSRIQR